MTIDQPLGDPATVTVTARLPAALDYGGYHSGYNFPNYATSG